jgi:ABC-type polysaccharide/polyol phosphate export permease
MWAAWGFEHVSRFAFLASALLTSLGCGAWRALDGLGDQLRRARGARAEDLFEDYGSRAPSLGLGLLRLIGYRELLRNLVWKDLKLKYRGSVLGFVWSLANPVVMLAVYYVAFTHILGIRKPGFVFFLMIGLLAWTFFSATTAMATGTIVDSGGLLRSVRFPRMVLPLSTVFFNLAQYQMTFGVLLPVMLVGFGVAPSWPMVAYPVILALLVVFTIGVALIVSTATTYFRDVKHLVEVGLAVLFWLTPVVYDLADVPERLRLPLLLAPVTPFVTALHDVFYRSAWPDASIWMAALAWSVTMFAAGVTVFLTFEDRFAEHA